MSATRCPACGHDFFVAAPGQCSRCGYASGEANRCPHCSAVARVDGAGRGAICAACGGPRILGNYGGEVATTALREQKTLLTTAKLASVATVIQSVFAAVATLLGLLIAPAALAGKLFVFALAAIPILLALRSRARAKDARAKATAASTLAWQAAAEDVARSAHGGVTATALGKTLGVTEAEADALLTSLAVSDRTRIDVGDDAEIRYSVAPQVRVADPLEERDLLAEQIDALTEGVENKERTR